jgi:hypothetical protein
MILSPTPAFACVYISCCRLAPVAPRKWEKQGWKLYFKIFWNNINQLIVDDHYV